MLLRALVLASTPVFQLAVVSEIKLEFRDSVEVPGIAALP